MRRPLAFLILAAAVATPASVKADETGSAMADAARRFVAALDDGQRSQATFPFESAERMNWHWIPRERQGVPIKEMTPEQRSLAFGLLATGLSTEGFLKATTIMSLEEILRVQEAGRGPVRDPELYYFSVFGEPSDEGEWGYRVEGHHLSLNYTMKDGQVASVTPFMFGSNPATVKSGSRQGLRNLEEIESPINELLASLDQEQRGKAIVSESVPDVTTSPNSARPEPAPPEGISSEKLTTDQRELLRDFVLAYYENFPDAVRERMADELAGAEGTYHFAWYGPADPSKPHALKVQGPGLVIDFNDKQDEANHIHTFYRSVVGDFGLPASE